MKLQILDSNALYALETREVFWASTASFHLLCSKVCLRRQCWFRWGEEEFCLPEVCVCTPLPLKLIVSFHSRSGKQNDSSHSVQMYSCMSTQSTERALNPQQRESTESDKDIHSITNFETYAEIHTKSQCEKCIQAKTFAVLNHFIILLLCNPCWFIMQSNDIIWGEIIIGIL